MGDWYDIDVENGCINYQTAATGWQMRSVKYTEKQLWQAESMAERHAMELGALFKSFVENNDNAGYLARAIGKVIDGGGV
jgi:hypothetical protein